MARREYDRALELDPGYAEVWNNIGTLEQARKRFKPAVRAYKKAIETKPGLATPWKNLGNAYLALGQVQEAFEAYQEAFRLDPTILESQGPGIPAAGIDAATQSFYLAKLLAANGQTDAAIDFLRRAKEAGFRDFARVEVRPGLPRGRRGPALQGARAGAVAVSAPPPRATTVESTRGGSDENENPGPVRDGGPGRLVRRRRRPARAGPGRDDRSTPCRGPSSSPRASRGTARSPPTARRSPRARTTRRCATGSASATRGRATTKAARAAYKKALDLRKDYAEAWNNLGTLDHARGKYKQAISAYGKAIQLKPQDAVFHKNLGAAWLARGDVERALEAWTEAFRLDPAGFEGDAIKVPAAGVTLARQYYLYAKLLAARGETEKALEYLVKAHAAGFNDFGKVEGDRDFATLVVDPRYAALK